MRITGFKLGGAILSWDARTTVSVLSVYNVIIFFPNIFRVMTVAVGSSNRVDSGKRSPQQFHLESKQAFVKNLPLTL